MLKTATTNWDNSASDLFAEDISSFVFRPVHYLGSKLRVLAAIEQAVDLVDPSFGPVCDLFSGSATVSRYLSRRRRVIAVDIQEYARVLAEAVLNGRVTLTQNALDGQSDLEKALAHAIDPLIRLEQSAQISAKSGNLEPLCELLEFGGIAALGNAVPSASTALIEAAHLAQARINELGLAGSATVCTRHFGGRYFSFAQAVELDALAEIARRCNSSVPLAAVLSTASHLVNSIGKQFAQPIRPRDKTGEPKRHVVKKILTDRRVSARDVFLRHLRNYEDLAFKRRDHVAVRADFREALGYEGLKPSVVYADPPYTRDHYSRFYHSLETIAVGDDPTISKSNLGGGGVQSRGGYRLQRHQSPFCIKSEAPSAFSLLFSGVANLGVPLVLSYSGYDPSMHARPRVMELDQVVELAQKHFSDIQLKQLSNLEHMKLNRASLNKAAKGTTEVLLLCR